MVEQYESGLEVIDYVIIGVYLVVIVVVGLLSGKLQDYLTRRSQQTGTQSTSHHRLGEEGAATEADQVDSYFLGSRSIPFWALAASGMASNLDVSGTMINCALIYSLGVKGMLIELRGGLTMGLAFLMAFLGKWSRRSNVMTVAEWMVFRFGPGRQGHWARLSTAITAVMMSIGSITYFAVGSGIFVAEFLNMPEYWLGLRKEFWAALIMTVLSMLYTVATGLSGVVWTDVFQGVVIFIAVLVVCILSMVNVTLPNEFNVSTLFYNGTASIQQTTWSEWSNPLPSLTLNFDPESQYSVYNPFLVACGLYFFKMMIEGYGGAQGYMAQRYYATKDERDASQMTGLWIFLLAFRWPFIIAICMLGIFYGNGYGKDVIQDPEVVLPRVISAMLPVGVKGLVVAAMISAAMSTFDSTVNACAAIIVKDIYQAYIHKSASQKILILVGRLSSIVVVIVALVFMLAVKNVNDIWGWVTMSLGSGLVVPNLMRWYWHRVNGYGYSISLFVGAGCAVIFKIVLTATNYNLPEYYVSLILSVISFVLCAVISLLTPPTDPDVLLRFYGMTQPFGIWGPVKRRFKVEFNKQVNMDTLFDNITLCAALPWQYILYLLWMSIIMSAWITFGVSAGITAVLTVILYFTWFRRLRYQHNNKRVVELETQEDLDAYNNVQVELQDVTTQQDDNTAEHNSEQEVVAPTEDDATSTIN